MGFLEFSTVKRLKRLRTEKSIVLFISFKLIGVFLYTFFRITEAF